MSEKPEKDQEAVEAAETVKPGVEGDDALVTGAATETALEAGTQAGDNVVDVRRGMFGVSGSGDTSGYGGLVRTIAMPGNSQRPFGGWFDEVVDVLEEILDGEAGPGFDAAVEQVVVDRGELTLYVRREHLLAVLQPLRDDQDLRFEMSMGVSGVHYPNEKGRELHSVMHLLSITHSRRIRVETAVPDADPHLPSSVHIYPTNDWHERETWDFFGIIYDGHPALARIQMPDDWPGHPQRKDYPLGGVPVEYKGATVPAPDNRRAYN
ncbi:MAG TPA: NADH-quinone oxidoreductase subunit C [Actinomycetales bacterium]|nr:NADH-quinone oxidoreductase subunit C [Actinomycetales bacterium]